MDINTYVAQTADLERFLGDIRNLVNGLEARLDTKEDIGVYIIVNLKTLNCYVGHSQELHRRWLRHKRDLYKENHHNENLQRAWIKDGEENFVCITIENCTIAALEIREDWWIGELNPQYNMTSNVTSFRRGKTNSLEHNRKVSAALRKLNIPHEPVEPKLNNYGENNGNGKLTLKDVRKIKWLLEHTEYTMTEIAEFFGVSPGAISNISTGRTWDWVGE